RKVSQFVAVELSAIYHDVVKDRLYTDAPDSPRRRATQSALYRLVTGLCQTLAPILAFTTDEAWEFIPGVKAGESVHLTDWQPLGFTRPAEEQVAWQKLMELRERALPELEKARQSKTIGKALEARLTASGPAGYIGPMVSHEENLRELLNVSQLRLAESDLTDLRIEVVPADGVKCARCWHWETDVGRNTGHPTICGRCLKTIGAT
ncbi:MAG: class I tRNA ligase family protein, partial [Candidatus Omnitrophica bacterium]|nr:class I tRNA ligase family protein [Candidatus Omnitrophota bacterium]